MKVNKKKPRYYPMPITTLAHGIEYWVYDNEEAYIPSGFLHGKQEEVQSLCNELNANNVQQS